MSPNKHPGTCAVHENMLSKEEFRWVVAGLVAIFAGVLSYAVVCFASNDKVDAIDKRVVKVESTLEVVTDMNRKLDELLKK